MSEAEVECLLADAREVVGLVKQSNASVDTMLRRAAVISERVKMMDEQQRTLEEVFAQTSDGIRRRQLLEELQKENRERLKCLEENAILRENLTEGFDTFMEIYERNKALCSRVAVEKERSSFPTETKRQDDEEKEFELGQTAAVMKEKLRSFVSKSEEVIAKGEEESRELNMFVTALNTWNKGRMELLQPEMMVLFKKYYKTGMHELREMISARMAEEGQITPQEEENQQNMSSSVVKKTDGPIKAVILDAIGSVCADYGNEVNELTLKSGRLSLSDSSDDDSSQFNDTIVDTIEYEDDQVSTCSTVIDTSST